MARMSKLRLNKGDIITISEGGEDRSWNVERGVANHILAQGELGEVELKLTPLDGGGTLRIEVKTKDAEGRERLTDD